MCIKPAPGGERLSKGTVLISGAGIAGSTLAYWLAQHGFQTTVVERSGAQRSSGSPVDVKGPAVDVAERMGLMPRLRAAATEVTDLSFVDTTGRRVGGLKIQHTGGRDVELPRGDLASILYAASQDPAEFLFGDAIVGLSQDQHGVNVNFDLVPARHFDLVIAADGLHSWVRRLAFGPETEFVQHKGIYVATLPFDGRIERPREVVMHNTPGRSVTIHPARGEAVAAFMFRSPTVPDFRYRDTAQHKRLLAAAFAGVGWRVPELLERVQAAQDLYFDSVSQVRMPVWSRGRVALLGDAASCVSLFGDGSTLAIAGAFRLAEELAASPAAHELAFRRYEAEHRRLVEPKQRSIALAAALLIPSTRLGISARNLGVRLWPVADGAVRRLTAACA
jgi:2-polyprenyl-6-methoxyphenol hydroxylase-like FAD-dependent oxidoreductase